MKRLATALVLIPLLVWVVLAGPDWAFVLVVAAVGVLAFREYDTLVAEHGFTRAGIPGMAAGVVLLLTPAPGLAAVLMVLAAFSIALLLRDLSKVLPAAAAFTLGLASIFGPWRCAIELRTINHHWLMFALAIVWAGDTAALYAGKAFGHHKMALHISPNKTWEGAVGSIAAGLITGAVYAHYLLPSVSLGLTLGIAAAGNIAGQFGDLCESALKRGAHVKDSGSSLPGHGGWLDRVDASLFSVPVVYVLVRFVVSG